MAGKETLKNKEEKSFLIEGIDEQFQSNQEIEFYSSDFSSDLKKGKRDPKVIAQLSRLLDIPASVFDNDAEYQEFIELFKAVETLPRAEKRALKKLIIGYNESSLPLKGNRV